MRLIIDGQCLQCKQCRHIYHIGECSGRMLTKVALKALSTKKVPSWHWATCAVHLKSQSSGRAHASIASDMSAQLAEMNSNLEVMLGKRNKFEQTMEVQSTKSDSLLLRVKN